MQHATINNMAFGRNVDEALPPESQISPPGRASAAFCTEALDCEGSLRAAAQVLRVLQAIQYVQSNPDEATFRACQVVQRAVSRSLPKVPLKVCPAGWQPGDKTMKPDQEGKKECPHQDLPG